MKLKKWGGGSGGCNPRIEAIVKLKKSGSGWWGDQSGVRSGWGLVGGSTNVVVVVFVELVTQELKV